MNVRRVLFRDFVAPELPYHAILRTIPSEHFPALGMHCHDFYEWMVVVDGCANHVVNDTQQQLRKGQLVFLRPDDVHAIEATAGSFVVYVNVSFPGPVWRDFALAAGILDWARTLEEAPTPTIIDVVADRRQSLETESLRVIRVFHRGATRLALCQFLAIATQTLLDANPRSLVVQPQWLTLALDRALSGDILDLSIESLVECSGVSFGHLSHTMKKCLGITPTQYINQIRIDRAGFELASTDKSIVCIAFDCGFQNLSYFYRRFSQVHKKSPKQYRLDARRALSV